MSPRHAPPSTLRHLLVLCLGACLVAGVAQPPPQAPAGGVGAVHRPKKSKRVRAANAAVPLHLGRLSSAVTEGATQRIAAGSRGIDLGTPSWPSWVRAMLLVAPASSLGSFNTWRRQTAVLANAPKTSPPSA